MTNPQAPAAGVELLPCPWCGAAQITIREGSTFRWRIVECAQCGAGPGEFRSDNRFDLTDDDRREAHEFWNRRAVVVPAPAVPMTEKNLGGS